jgi:flagellar hook assembly protein FlgD
LQVFDILGREVATLVDERQAAGSYTVTWSGRDMRNIPVTSGMYFYRLESGAYTKTNKMVLVK